MERVAMPKVSIPEKFGRISEHWRPKVVGELNGQEVKLVKCQGTFVWHRHANEDELFLVWRGRLRVEFRDHAIDLEPGELLIVPRGVEHRTIAESEAEVIVFEPALTVNTGNVRSETFTAPLGDRI
jgi:mannose-6-phosphate isomerase-like protein (cupin superfamily)